MGLESQREPGASGACSLPSDEVSAIKADGNYRKWCQNKWEGLAAGDKVPLGGGSSPR